MAAKLFRLFNLIVAHEPWPPARREALHTLRSLLGAGNVRVFASPPSLLLVKVPDPYSVPALLYRELGPSTPILRAVPLEGETPPYVEDVAEAVRELVAERAERMGGSPSFAIRLEGHLYRRSDMARLHKDEAVKIVARDIDLPVNLSSPDILVLIKVVRVERAQRYAGIMVGRPGDIFSRARLGGREE